MLTLLEETQERYRALGPGRLDEIAARYGLPPELSETIGSLALVLPFRVNDYVLSELIDWSAVPSDPIFQLVFPQRGMLSESDERRLAELRMDSSREADLRALVRQIRAGLNPHPSGQMELNVPTVAGVQLPGIQHKYRETVLYFPSHGQTCHAYCTYCFRWAQFVGGEQPRFAVARPDALVRYLTSHPAVTDVLVTGGDPLIMTTDQLRRHLEPLLTVPTLRTIRIGTKSLAYWPQRFVIDRDADDLLRLFQGVIATGRNLAVMAHFTHPRELHADVARLALDRIRGTGALVYCQSPLVAHVNDEAATLADLWRSELSAGAVPYYLFVERDTGPHDYFRVSLDRAVELFQAAYRSLPGLARTVRGPSMSTTPGKVLIDGVAEAPDGRYLQLRMVQARDAALVGRPFRARFADDAYWLHDLELDRDTPPDLARALSPWTRYGTETD